MILTAHIWIIHNPFIIQIGCGKERKSRRCLESFLCQHFPTLLEYPRIIFLLKESNNAQEKYEKSMRKRVSSQFSNATNILKSVWFSDEILSLRVCIFNGGSIPLLLTQVLKRPDEHERANKFQDDNRLIDLLSFSNLMKISYLIHILQADMYAIFQEWWWICKKKNFFIHRRLSVCMHTSININQYFRERKE